MKRGAARKPTRHISIEFESQRNIRTSYYFPHAYLNSQASYEARRYNNGSADKRGYNFNSQASYEARPAKYSMSQCCPLFQFTCLIRGPTFNRVLAVIQAVRFNSQASYEARL